MKKELKSHKLAKIFPMIHGEEFESLKADIKESGLIESIVLYEGLILDGRNRYKACVELDIDIHTTEYVDNDPLGFVLSLNLHRRHLKADQRAAIAVDLLPIYEAEAKKRQVESGGDRKSSNYDKSVTAKLQQPIYSKRTPMATDQAAKELHVSGRYVADMKKIKADDPEVFESIKSGDKKLADVKKEEKKQKLENKKAELIEAAANSIESNKPIVYNEGFDKFFNRIESQSMDLLITDPPYSTDVDDIESFVDGWLFDALDKIKETGRAYICIGAYPKELMAYLNKLSEQTRFIVDNPLIWTYRNTLGITPKRKYNLNYQVILHLYTTESPDLDTSVTNEMFSVQDINAPDGRQGDRHHTWQKPNELAMRLIRHGSKDGDSVFDPFTCTGTFPIAAAKLNRIAIGSDISKENLSIAINRGCQYG